MTSTNTAALPAAIAAATEIAQRIQVLAHGPDTVAEMDAMLHQLAEYTRQHPAQGALISCQVFALYQVATMAQAGGDWARAGDMLARLGAVLAAIPGGQDVTVGSTGDGKQLTGRNLMMTALLAHITGRLPGIADTTAAMKWLETSHPGLQNQPPLEHVRRLELAPVLALIDRLAVE